MTQDEIKKWLTEGEYTEYLAWDIMIKGEDLGELESIPRRRIRVYKSLAASRKRSEERKAMMKKHEWADVDRGDYSCGIISGFCPECGNHKNKGHAPDCAYVVLLQGLPNEEVKNIKPRTICSHCGHEYYGSYCGDCIGDGGI